MKRIAPLFLLPLLLAACGQPSTPSAVTPPSSSGLTGPTGPSHVARFETEVARDLAALGLTGELSAQAVTPKSYLNVLKVSDSSARAYLKTTYPAATGCALDWGDGSATAAVTTPTPGNVSTDQQNHTYAQSGNYTITLTCGTDIKKASFKATVAVSDLGLFDDHVGSYYAHTGGEEGWAGSPYVTKGFTFDSGGNYMERNGWGLPQGHIGLAMTCYSDGQFSRENAASFDLTPISAATLYSGSVTITGYDSENRAVGTANFVNDASMLEPIETKTLNWKNVNRVVCSNGSYLLIDDMSVKVNLPPV